MWDKLRISVLKGEYMCSVNERPLFHNCIYDKKGIWFWDIVYNGLFFAREAEGKYTAELKGLYRGQLLCESNEPLFNKIVKWNGKIVLVPALSDEIMIYDIETAKSEYIDLSAIPDISGKKGKFWDCILVEDRIYMIGYFTSYVVEVNLTSCTITNYLKLYEEQSDQTVYFKNAIICNSCIYIPDCLTNRLFILSMDDFCISERRIKKSLGGFSFIASDKETGKMWISPRREGPIVCYDSMSHEEIVYGSFPTEYGVPKGRASIGFITIFEDRCHFFPLVANSVLEISKIDNKIIRNKRLSEALYTDDIEYENTQKVMFVQQFGNKIYIYGGVRREWTVYDCIDDSVEVLSMSFKEDVLNMIKVLKLKKYYKDNSLSYENKEYTINEFLQVI